MKKVIIPGTDLCASQICLGGGPLCNPEWEDGIFDILDKFVDAGGNFVDTAAVYGMLEYDGISTGEKILGKWYKSRKAHGKMIITTKGAHPRFETMNISRMSLAELRGDIEDSLKNLCTDTIDLYWLHRDDRDLPAGEIIERVNTFIKEGKIRYIGASNWSADRIAQANDYAKKHGLIGFCANQPMWSLATVNKALIPDPTLCHMDSNMYRLHRENNLTAVPYASQAGGYFQKLHNHTPIPDNLKLYQTEENNKIYKLLEEIAEEKNATVNQIALAYLLHSPFPVFPIVGCYLKEKLYDSLGATEINLSISDIENLTPEIYK